MFAPFVQLYVHITFIWPQVILQRIIRRHTWKLLVFYSKMHKLNKNFPFFIWSLLAKRLDTNMSDWNLKSYYAEMTAAQDRDKEQNAWMGYLFHHWRNFVFIKMYILLYFLLWIEGKQIIVYTTWTSWRDNLESFFFYHFKTPDPL